MPGAQVFPGFRPSNEVDTARNSVAATPTSKATFTQRLRLGLAGRYEHYSDFGNTADGKLTVRVSAAAAVRRPRRGEHRLPRAVAGQSYFSAISTNFLPGRRRARAVRGRHVPGRAARRRAPSAPTDLKPEQSVHFSAGVVWHPIAPLEITADYYRIDIDDRIVFSGNFTGGRSPPLLQPLGANGARFFTNAIDTRDEGLGPDGRTTGSS